MLNHGSWFSNPLTDSLPRVVRAAVLDEAAVHEIPALPSDEEVAAIAAEQEAGAAAAAEVEITAAEEAIEKAQSDEAKPETDESKES